MRIRLYPATSSAVPGRLFNVGSAAECGGPARSLRECIFGRGLGQMERLNCFVFPICFSLLQESGDIQIIQDGFH